MKPKTGTFISRRGISRRGALLALAGGALVAAGASVLAPTRALAASEDAKKIIDGLVKGKPQEGKVKLTAPEIAENGNAVPVTIAVEGEISEANYVKALHLIAEENPNPLVASFTLSPGSGAEVQTRIRLMKTQHLTAIAELSDGTVWTARREVKVTIGGCGG
jgi:sulfur-oxidizing protein SoxY